MDHAGFAEAARYGEIVPALVLDPLDDARLARNARRAEYYAGAVASLERDLGAFEATLVVRRGSFETTILALAREAGAATITWCAAYDARSATRDRALRATLEAAGFRVAIVHDAPAVAPEVTAALRADEDGRGYRAFAAYEAVWAQAARAPIAGRFTFAAHGLASDRSWQAHEHGDCGDESPDPTRALAAFDRYLAGAVLGYPSALAIPAGEATARISAALSFGVLSARTLLARIDARARDPFLLTEEKLALAAFVRALVRRDFFLQLAWYFDETGDVALQPRMRNFPFALDHPALAAWRDGETGYPLVDAGIRQLHATGWMHPRARAVAASFCAFDLGVDWRVGRDMWDVHLVEDDGALRREIGSGLSASVPISRRFPASTIHANSYAKEIRAGPTFAGGFPNSHTSPMPIFSMRRPLIRGPNSRYRFTAMPNTLRRSSITIASHACSSSVMRSSSRCSKPRCPCRASSPNRVRRRPLRARRERSRRRADRSRCRYSLRPHRRPRSFRSAG